MKGYLTGIQVIFLAAGSLAAQSAITTQVSAHMDIYRAGGYNDGSDGAAPAVLTFAAAPGQTLTFGSITGTWTCNYGVASFGPDGTMGQCNHPDNFYQPIGPLEELAQNGAPRAAFLLRSSSLCGGAGDAPLCAFSGYENTDFSAPLVGMFLEDGLPAAAPPTLRFYVSDSSQGGIQTNFTSLSPAIGQVFFIGDGVTGTGSGATQMFQVPPTATHLYLGYIDACSSSIVPSCYFDNEGTLTATVNVQIRGLCNTGQTAVNSLGCTGELVPPEPPGGVQYRDGNWDILFQPLQTPPHSPCNLSGYVRAWVDTPDAAWLPNGASPASEWITPFEELAQNGEPAPLLSCGVPVCMAARETRPFALLTGRARGIGQAGTFTGSVFRCPQFFPGVACLRAWPSADSSPQTMIRP